MLSFEGVVQQFTWLVAYSHISLSRGEAVIEVLINMYEMCQKPAAEYRGSSQHVNSDHSAQIKLNQLLTVRSERAVSATGTSAARQSGCCSPTIAVNRTVRRQTSVAVTTTSMRPSASGSG